MVPDLLLFGSSTFGQPNMSMKLGITRWRCAGPQTDRVQERPRESSQGSSEKELAARRPEMKLENSSKYHSAANDMVGNAVQRVIGLSRVLKDVLEANIKRWNRTPQ